MKVAMIGAVNLQLDRPSQTQPMKVIIIVMLSSSGNEILIKDLTYKVAINKRWFLICGDFRILERVAISLTS